MGCSMVLLSVLGGGSLPRGPLPFRRAIHLADASFAASFAGARVVWEKVALGRAVACPGGERLAADQTKIVLASRRG